MTRRGTAPVGGAHALLVPLTLLASALVACDGPVSTPATHAAGPVDAAATSAPAYPAEESCPATAAHPAPPGGQAGEVRGGGPGTSLWGLLFLTGERLTTNTETKIVWRMTGSGDLSMRATGPDGSEVRPIWGPTGHGGSTWSRPGDEWGTGWRFPTPGCWTVHAQRSDAGSARALLRVAD